MNTLKKLKIGTAICSSLLIFSCTGEKEKTTTEETATAAKTEPVTVSIKEYDAVIASKDSSERAFRDAMDEIEKGFTNIREKEGALDIAVATGDKAIVEKKDNILHNISVLSDLLEKNRKRVKDLSGKVARMRKENRTSSEEIARLNEYVTQKEKEIADLNDKISQQSASIESLNKKVTELQDMYNTTSFESQRLDKELHKGYYATGTYSELKKHNVIKKEGGVLGIGATQELKSDPDKAYFTEVDIRQATGIVINGKKPKLITHHPVNSYELREESKNVEYLTIKDPDQFWSTSKYLVVEVK